MTGFETAGAFPAHRSPAWRTVACSLLPVKVPADDLRVETPWALSLPAVAKNGAAFLAIRNRASEADELIGADTPSENAPRIRPLWNEDRGVAMISWIARPVCSR